MNSYPLKIKNYCSYIGEYRAGWRVGWSWFFGFASVFVEIQSTFGDAIR